MLFHKTRCIYCNDRTTIDQAGRVICKECGRENKPMQPISILQFEAIPEEYLTALRAKKPGFLEKKSHEEILSASEEGRLRIASAVSDGFYSSKIQANSDTTEDDQFIRSPDGIPVKGRFYSSPLQPEGEPLWVIQLERKNGKHRYAIVVEEQYEKLNEAISGIAYHLFPCDQYDPEKRSDGY